VGVLAISALTILHVDDCDRVASRYFKGPELLVDFQEYDYSLDMWSLVGGEGKSRSAMHVLAFRKRATIAQALMLDDSSRRATAVLIVYHLPQNDT
jgi:hypothetical protein